MMAYLCLILLSFALAPLSTALPARRSQQVSSRQQSDPATCEAAPGVFSAFVVRPTCSALTMLLTSFGQSFGDSYSDVGARMSGGPMWPDYASGIANIPSHAFGVAGAVCSTALTPLDTLPVVEHQLPAFADRTNELNLDITSTVFVLWIGTNDAVSLYFENCVSRLSELSVCCCRAMAGFSTAVKPKASPWSTSLAAVPIGSSPCTLSARATLSA